MSSIPNLPESVDRGANVDSTNADAAFRHLLNNKKEIAQTNGETQANGVYSSAQWHLHEAPVENQRPFKVIVIGAGYSGIYLGIRLPERLRNCEVIIYEKNAGVGGTWSVLSSFVDGARS